MRMYVWKNDTTTKITTTPNNIHYTRKYVMVEERNIRATTTSRAENIWLGDGSPIHYAGLVHSLVFTWLERMCVVCTLADVVHVLSVLCVCLCMCVVLFSSVFFSSFFASFIWIIKISRFSLISMPTPFWLGVQRYAICNFVVQ